MTREETIKELVKLRNFATKGTKTYRALDAAIKTLEAQRWISCDERLPEENTPVLLGVKFNDDFKYFVTARMDYNYWQGLGRNIRGEIRWMPLPKPYTEDSDG